MHRLIEASRRVRLVSIIVMLLGKAPYSDVLRVVAIIIAIGASAVRAAEPVPPFSQTLTAEQKQRLGLAHLTPAQLGELDAAVGAYQQGGSFHPAPQTIRAGEDKLPPAEVKAAQASETAAADDQRKLESGKQARAPDGFKPQREETKRELIVGRVVGPFRGWRGGTYFPLDNGQVWRQSGTETYELPTVQNAKVEIAQSSNGYWRLKYQGAWITVKRLQ